MINVMEDGQYGVLSHVLVAIVDIECLCTLVVLCGAFAVITSAVSFPG